MPEEGRSASRRAAAGLSREWNFCGSTSGDDVRMHYTVKTLPGPENVVPPRWWEVLPCALSRDYLDQVAKRFRDIVRGAALMAGDLRDRGRNRLWPTRCQT